MKLKTLAIVGVGLIGGSIGLAVKQRRLAERVLGVGRHEASLRRAQAAGAIDEISIDLVEAVRGAEMAVFCTPVDRIAEQVLQVGLECAPGTLLTDAGSAKAVVVRAIDGRLPKGVSFVGSHPLAGSEKRGPEHATANLFENKVTIVTPTSQTDAEALERTTSFWRALGARVRLMDPEEHDRALALTSHLPHLAAAALAGILKPELFDLTAAGFRDTTRVAAGDPSIWTGIFLQNKEAVLAALDHFDERLQRFREALKAGDRVALDSLLDQAKKVREDLENRD
jgi:prephenate dehydrogenase